MLNQPDRRSGADSACAADEIQQSLDAIAVEVERVGEGQRYVVKLKQALAENAK